MAKFEIGAELETLRLKDVLPLLDVNERHLKSDKHRVKMIVHAKGVEIEHLGKTHFVWDGACVECTVKEKPDEKPQAKK